MREKLFYLLCDDINRDMAPDKPLYSAVPPGTPPKQADPVYVKIDRSGRAGKTVTTVTGLQMHPAGKEELMRRFQKLCGAGGTFKAGVIEIQGDHRPRIGAELERLGYRVKIV
jgi:translation initiation factor 1